MQSRKLRLAKTRHSYHLKDGDELLGALQLHNPHGSRATARIGEKKWTLKRANIMKRDVHIHEKDAAEPTATFCAGWNCKGVLQLNGRTYYWGPANKLWTHWTWKDERGGEVIRVKTKPNWLDMEGEIHAHGDEHEEEQKYLALVGWYMLLLHHQDPDALVFAGIESSIKKLKDLVSR